MGTFLTKCTSTGQNSEFSMVNNWFGHSLKSAVGNLLQWVISKMAIFIIGNVTVSFITLLAHYREFCCTQRFVWHNSIMTEFTNFRPETFLNQLCSYPN